MKNYLSFNPETGFDYFADGGVYSFEMNGKTYFTTKTDLYNSMQTQHEYGKPIEAQEKLNTINHLLPNDLHKRTRNTLYRNQKQSH